MDKKAPKIQKEIAGSVDTIMELAEKIYNLIPLYGNIPWSEFDLKCTLLRGQCQKLSGRLLELEQAMAGMEPLSESLQISYQILRQNQLLLKQNENALIEFKAHEGMIKGKESLAHSFENEAVRTDLQDRLQEMLKH